MTLEERHEQAERLRQEARMLADDFGAVAFPPKSAAIAAKVFFIFTLGILGAALMTATGFCLRIGWEAAEETTRWMIR